MIKENCWINSSEILHRDDKNIEEHNATSQLMLHKRWPDWGVECKSVLSEMVSSDRVDTRSEEKNVIKEETFIIICKG